MPLSLLPPSFVQQFGHLFGPMQLVGYLACAVSFAALIMTSHRRFLLVGATGSFIWALHYHLLGERVAAALAATSGARSSIAMRVHALPRSKRIALTVAACALVILLSALAWSGVLTALPMIAVCMTTAASFWLLDRAYRRVALAADTLWLLFGVLAGSIGGALAALIAIGLNCWALHRYARVAAGERPCAGTG